MGGRVWQAGTVILLITSCGTPRPGAQPSPPLRPPAAAMPSSEPAPPGTPVATTVLAALPPGVQARRENCQRYGDAAIVSRIAGRVVRVATHRYDLSPLVSQADVNQARRRMGDLLIWRLGSADAVCDQYVQRGIGPFERRFADEGAAILLDLIHFQGSRPVYRVPKALLRSLGSSGKMTPQLLRNLGLPTRLRYQQTRDAYLIPLDPDQVISPALVRATLQALSPAARSEADDAGNLAGI